MLMYAPGPPSVALDNAGDRLDVLMEREWGDYFQLGGEHTHSWRVEHADTNDPENIPGIEWCDRVALPLAPQLLTAAYVSPAARVYYSPAARRVLKRWAAVTGHERIWFRDEVVDLEPPAGLDGEYGTRCPGCGLDIVDSGPGLMKFVREAGHFPMHCFTCGNFVPQWQPVRREARDRGAAPSRRRTRDGEHELRVVDA